LRLHSTVYLPLSPFHLASFLRTKRGQRTYDHSSSSPTHAARSPRHRHAGPGRGGPPPPAHHRTSTRPVTSTTRTSPLYPPPWTACKPRRPTSTRSFPTRRESRSSSSTQRPYVPLPPPIPHLTPLQTAVLSLASTQSTLLSHEVYLTDRIDNPSRSLPPGSSQAGAYPPTSGRAVERLPHLKCICLLRPTEESIAECERELKEGRYGEYWLCEY
jgi:hypothetical protein